MKSAIIRTNSENKDFQSLVKELDADLAVRDGEDHSFYHQFNGITHIRHALVLRVNDITIGCCAFKKSDSKTAEIKRMFVKRENRGKGFSKLILSELENWAKEEGFSTLILETGKKNFEAAALYQKMNYQRTPNFAQYIGIENSLCFEKNI